MSICDILKMGDPRLHRIAQPVPAAMLGSAELNAIIQDMLETMEHANMGWTAAIKDAVFSA